MFLKKNNNNNLVIVKSWTERFVVDEKV